MSLGFIPQVANLLCDNPAQQRKPQVGTHRLRHTDPVITGCTFHGFITLIDDHRYGLIMRRVYGVATGVVRIPGPVWTATDANRINTQKVTGGLDQTGRCLRIELSLCFIRHAVLQQHKRTQCATLRHRRRRLADVATAFSAILNGFTHVAKLRSCKHVSALRYSGHSRLVDIGCWLVDTCQRFKWMFAIDKASFRKRHGIHCIF